MNTFSRRTYILAFAVASMCLLCTPAYAFSTCKTVAKTHNTALLSTTNDSHGMTESPTPEISRRSIFQKAMIASFAAFVAKTTTSAPAFALESSSAANDLDSYLYKIIRVREATQQERRLIQTGKFKDIQRANVKLAVKFMVSNYRLADCVVGASAYLKGGNSAQMRAIDVGQTAVQNLQTILEYFDTSDVENIKVGSSSMGGKEELVLKGLEAAQIKLDEFLGFFDEGTIKKIKAQVQEENELNIKEFDKSLGDIINLPPPS